MLAACGDRGAVPPDSTAARGAPDAAATPTVADAAPAPDDQPDTEAAAPAATALPIPAGGDEDTALRALSAVPVWDAVVERGRYLARRQASGVIIGRLGATVASTDYRWLIDDKRGGGALAIRMSSAHDDDLTAGERVASWGAWSVDDQRTWYWQAERLALLESRPPKVDPIGDPTPGHVIATLSEPPAEAKPVSQTERGPAIILFEVGRIPRDPASGWEIADRTEWKPVARLFLPGEGRTYGAQDLRSPGEHWTLRRKVRYAVAIRRFLPAKPGALARMYAVGAPWQVAGRTAR
ncbi:MAG: hypothetical protein AAGC55_18730 [Myxococcota bacterium]